jgi:hypothetical protein
MSLSEFTLPTIHLNGTGADTLEQEYRALRMALKAAEDVLCAATCNARDFYPQGPEAWKAASTQRTEAFLALRQLIDYAEAWELHAMEHRRRR